MKQFCTIEVIKHFFIYAFGAFILKGMSVILAPIIMRILTPADYGLLALVTNFIAVACTCAGLGLRQLLTIEYFHCDTIGQKRLINDMLIVYVVLLVPVFILLFLGVQTINNYFFVGQAQNFVIILCLLVAFFKFFAELFYQILQYAGQAFMLTGVQIIAAVILFGCNISLLYFFNWGIVSVVVAHLASVGFVFIIALFFYINQMYYTQVDISCSVSKSAYYLKRGLPFVPRVLFAWILAVGDRWVLAKYATLADVGIYSVADMFGQLFQVVVILPFSYAYIPYMMRRFAQVSEPGLVGAQETPIVARDSGGVQNETQKIGKTHKQDVYEAQRMLDRWNLKNMWIAMVSLVALISLGLVLCKPIIRMLLPPAYHIAMNYIWSLLLGYIFLFGSYFASIYLQFHKYIYFTVFALLVPAVCNIILNLLLVPTYAIWGCVIATVISYALYFVIMISYNEYVKGKRS